MIAAVGARMDGATGIDVVPTPPECSATALLDLVASTATGSGTAKEALLLVRDYGDGSMERAADVAAAALRDEGVVVRALRMPSTRFAAVVSVLCELGRFFPIGAVASAIRLVESVLSTTAYVDSVARLEQPAPSLVDHALSHLPGSRFLILPTRVIRRARPASPAAQGLGAGPCFAAASRDAAGQQWRRELVGSTGCRDVVTVWDRTRSWWRARRWAEVTTVGEPIATLRDRLSAVPVAACPWCGRLRAGLVPCCFCGAESGSGSGSGSGPAQVQDLVHSGVAP